MWKSIIGTMAAGAIAAGALSIAVPAQAAQFAVSVAGVYQSAYSADPLQALMPVHYDYPSYGPGICGSSLAFVIDLDRRDHVKPPAHAE